MRIRTAPAAFLAAAALVLAGAPIAHADPGADAQTAQEPILWYRQPASQTRMYHGGHEDTDKEWQQTTLPIGNGDLGATIYGEIGRERLVINEKTLWTGGPGSDPTYSWGNDVSKGRNGEALRDVQRLFEEGNNAEAAELARRSLTGVKRGADGSPTGTRRVQQGAYQAWGELLIDHKLGAAPQGENYRRDLNLRTGIASVSFQNGGATYEREMFVSHPHNVLAMRISTNRAEGLDLDIAFPSSGDTRRNRETIAFANNVMTTKGALHNNDLKYNSKVAVVADGSTITNDEDSFQVKGGASAVIYLSAATDFKYEFPAYRTGQSEEALDAQVNTVLAKAVAAGWDTIKSEHVNDHQALMDRVQLNLGWDNARPTDELLERYKRGQATSAEERTLETLLYQYGRYMTVGSSREDSQLPANLQGVWQRRNSDTGPEADWKSDYHLNVNLQMNYWPTYAANLYESADPMIRYIEGLVKPGRETAKVYFGTDGSEGSGFSAHTETTPYGWTAPGYNFKWGWSPAGVPWMLQNVYDAYEYSLDTELLGSRIYPLMKEQSDFYISKILMPTRDAYGVERLASAPAYSPEHGPVTAGNTYEQMLIWQLFNDTIHSAKVLDRDGDKVGNLEGCATANWNRDWARAGAFVNADANRSWSCALSLLKPVVVGTDNQIKEWYDEGALGKWKDGRRVDSFQSPHRHMSHLLGLFPGDLITVDDPTFMDAAKVSLNERTDSATGWGIAQRLNAWARTGDGNRVHRIIRSLFASSIYANLFDTHPPFQIDGNFGYSSAVNEMLMQSNSTFVDSEQKAHANYINVLPALPDVWASGSVKGLRARGNFGIDIDWADHSVTEVRLTSGSGIPATLAIAGARGAIVHDAEGTEVPITVLDDSHITFPTETGKTYTISGIRSVSVESVTGAHVIGGKDKTLTLRAKVRDGRLTDGSVPALTWQSSNPEIATVNNGVVTSVVDEGTVRIDVALADDPTVKASFDVTIISGRTATRQIDDADPSVKYSGRWGTYNTDSRNHKTTLHFSQGPRATATLTFTGSSVAVYGNINNHPSNTLADIKACVGEENCKTAQTSTASDLHQQKLVEFTELEYGEHTITVSPTNGGRKIELDFFEIVVPGVDRTPLQDQLQRLAGMDLDPKIYTPETLAAVEEARAMAVLVMNAEQVTADEVALTTDGLKDALDALARDSVAPSTVANLVADPATSSVVFTWNAAEDALGVKHYEVTGADKTLTTTELTATFEELAADTAYTFSVVAVDFAGNRSEAASVETRTKVDTPILPQPSDPEPETPALEVDEEAPFVAGNTVRFTVTGLQPLTLYKVQLHSDPIDLGEALSDAGGTLNVEAVLPATVSAGDHHIVVLSGEGVAARLPVKVAAQPGDNGGTTPGGSDQGGNKPGGDDQGGKKPGADQGGKPNGGDNAKDKGSAKKDGSKSGASSKLALTGWASGVLLLALGFGGAGVFFLRRSRVEETA